ncbi:hypothetical protein BDR22DRAFT_877001 [Usnea florida]
MNYWRSYLDGFQFTDRFDVAPGHIANPTARLTKIMPLKKQASAFSLATMAHAAWAISLGNIYQHDDILFWAVTSGRRPPRGEPLPGIETIMGPVPNGVYLRTRLRTDQTIGDLVQETQDHMISTIPHQRGVGLSREILGPLYIYQTNFNWHSLGNDIPARIIDFENLDGSVTRLEGRRDLHTPFRGPIPFVLDVWEHRDHLRVVAKWDQKLYDEDRVALMLDQLMENLRGIASAKAKCVGDLWKIQDSMNNETLNGNRCDDRKSPSVTQEAILDSPPPGADSGDKFRTKCEEGLINLTLATTDPSSPAESVSKPSIIVPGEKSVTFSWFQLEHEAKLLQQKLAATSDFTQKTISMALPNSVEVVCLFLAITRQRGIAALLNPSNKEIEFDFCLEDMKSVMVIVPKGAYDANSDVVRAAKRHGSRIAECYWDGQTVVLDIIVQKERTNGQNRVAPNTEPLDTDIALLLHTGGTTGRPKAVPLTHKNLDVSAKNICKVYNLGKDDRMMLLMPLYHVAGLLACLATLDSQGAIILPISYIPKTFWEDLTEHIVTWFTATPTMYQLILQLPPPKVMPPRLRFIRCSASPLPPALFRELESRFRIPVLNSYGLTEASSVCTSNPLPPGLQLSGSVGIPQGQTISIRDQSGALLNAGDEGEICLRGENIMKGYLNDSDTNAHAFTPDGFFRTGDYGYLDANNYLFITGRIKEFINKGGEKISPVEIR